MSHPSLGEDYGDQGWQTRQLNAFAAAWQQSVPPEIANFLPPDGDTNRVARRRLLLDLILVDLEFRWQRSVAPATTVAYEPALENPCDALANRPRLEDYARRYPEVGPLADLPDELIACEVRLRKQYDDWPENASYWERFGLERKSLWSRLEKFVRADDTNGDLAPDDTARWGAGRGLKIRCPHCQQPVEILDDQPVVEITCPSCNSTFNLLGSATERSAPRQLAHFELQSYLGGGAFGDVWQARDTKLGRLVAVKIPRRTQLSPKEIDAFLRDARAAAQLSHPNIVSVYEVGRQDDTVFIVSELVDGQPLDKWLQENRLTPKGAAALCRKIALAVEHAHQAGVVHRDLKPANVMMHRAGEPHVIDFGLAKRDAGEITMTVRGDVLGTPAYMAPEQAKGDSHLATARSDVYSLGVILFELITRDLPFRANSRQALYRQIIEDDPPPPRKFDPRIPKDMETICLRCLEKNPDKRIPSAQALADHLQAFAEDRPIPLRAITHTERAWRWCKRNPVVAGLSAAVAATLFVGIIATSLFALDARREAMARGIALHEKESALVEMRYERDRADEQTAAALASKAEAKKQAAIAIENEAEAKRQAAIAKENEVQAKKQEEKASRQLYYSQIARAQQFWNDGQYNLAINQLGRCRWEYRGWEHNYLFTNFGLGRGRFAEHTNPVTSVAFSPDGKRIASSSGTSYPPYAPAPGEIKVWNAQSGEETMTLMGHSRCVESVAFSPDGKRIASGSWDGTIKVWDAISGKETVTLKGRHFVAVSGVAFSPDGKRIAGAGDHIIKVWDATSGEDVLTFKEQTGMIFGVAFSPDGTRIASGGDRTIKLWDATSGEESLTLDGHTHYVRSVAYSPDGKRIASGSDDGTVKVWDASSGEKTLTPKEQTGRIFSVAFSPDGKRIVSGGEGTIKVWDAITGEETVINKGLIQVRSVAFSPDGKRIVSGDGNGSIEVWDANNGGEARTLKRLTEGVASVAFRPDGKQIVCVSGGKNIYYWDTTSSEPFRRRFSQFPQFSGVAFSPDGKRIAIGSANTIEVSDGGQEIVTLKGHKSNVTSLAFSPDGKWIVSGSGFFNATQPGEIKVWDATSGEETLTLQGQSKITGVAFSPDGKRIASGSGDGSIKVWDATSGKEALTLKGQARGVTSVAFSPDGKRIASGAGLGDNTVKVWDAVSGKEIMTLEGHTSFVRSVAFSPDGKRIASGSGAYDSPGDIKVWDAVSGEETLTLTGHAFPVMSVAFSPDGMRIVSGSGENRQPGEIRVWDATSVQARRKADH